MRVTSEVERVLIVRFELDLLLGLDVIRLARHDGGRSCCGVCVDEEEKFKI